MRKLKLKTYRRFAYSTTNFMGFKTYAWCLAGNELPIPKK